jgi:hypothetical protein
MLLAFCARMDELGGVAFLETDKLDSVRFYGRCGFEVREQGEVLGTPNWWMRRQARKPAACFLNQGRLLNAAAAVHEKGGGDQAITTILHSAVFALSSSRWPQRLPVSAHFAYRHFAC